MRKIRRLLIANRSEIAIRIIRTARKKGIETVAVFSDVDREALHVKAADQAILIGPAPSKESYLAIDRIITAALQSKCDAIHPGYGFLSENAAFATAVEEAGLIFVGPSAAAIDILGDKLMAKELAAKNQIPLVPGSDGPIDDPEDALSLAQEIGYPVMLKAAAGGGGKGMRIVYKPGEFLSAFERARSEALQSFGSGAVFIEKFIASPKHIEVQIIADKHGNVRHLFERDCSVQRRHQKVIEEAPAPIISEVLRKRMTDAAIKLAQVSGYENAGTVEFLVDRKERFYFLEMNTRLQVEHPVTEMITGLDLVDLQLDIAEGKPISFDQSEIHIHGHSIELRVYAEDASADFIPSIGTITKYEQPQGPGIRLDDGFQCGDDISIFYDPMIAKLVVHGPTRKMAIDRMIDAIQQFDIDGVDTTLDFGAFVCNHMMFRKGTHSTHFVKDCYEPQEVDQEVLDVIKKMSNAIYKQWKDKIVVPRTSRGWNNIEVP